MREIVTRGKTYGIHTVTGTVMSSDKHLETRVSGGGGGGYVQGGSGYSAPVQIRSTTVTHDDLFVKDTNGREHTVRLQNFNIACRQGHAVSVVSLIKEGAKSGHYVVVHNKTTDDRFWDDATLKSLHMPSGWRITMIVFGTWLLGLNIGAVALIAGAGLLGNEFRIRSACKKSLAANRSGIESYVVGLIAPASPIIEAPVGAAQLPA